MLNVHFRLTCLQSVASGLLSVSFGMRKSGRPIALPPTPSGLRYPQCIPSTLVPLLSTDEIMQMRVMVVNYPRHIALHNSNEFLAVDVDGYQIANHGLAIFSTLWNQQKYFARQEGRNKSGNRPLRPSPFCAECGDCCCCCCQLPFP